MLSRQSPSHVDLLPVDVIGVLLLLALLVGGLQLLLPVLLVVQILLLSLLFQHLHRGLVLVKFTKLFFQLVLLLELLDSFFGLLVS